MTKMILTTEKAYNKIIGTLSQYDLLDIFVRLLDRNKEVIHYSVTCQTHDQSFVFVEVYLWDALCDVIEMSMIDSQEWSDILKEFSKSTVYCNLFVKTDVDVSMTKYRYCRYLTDFILSQTD